VENDKLVAVSKGKLAVLQLAVGSFTVGSLGEYFLQVGKMQEARGKLEQKNLVAKITTRVFIVL